jgi:AcrR family transcriptional regulator
VKPVSRDAAPTFVCDLLQKKAAKKKETSSSSPSRALGSELRDDLSARTIAKALGQTTGFLYHHWGSLDGFLFEVSGIGWKRLVDSLVRGYESTKDPRQIIHAYIDFAAEYPVLYWLLAERPLSMDVVRATLEQGKALPSYDAFVTYFQLMAQAVPGVTLGRVRAMHAAAHGLASQLLSDRLASMPDALEKDDRAIARDIIEDIAEVFFTLPPRAKAAAATTSSATPRQTPARDRKAASPRRRQSSDRRSKTSPKASKK